MRDEAEDVGAAGRLSPAAWVFGLLGLIPFLAPPLVPLLLPGDRGLIAVSDIGQRLYAGVILSFLGGARFGRALAAPAGFAIALSMIPPLFALGSLLIPAPGPLVRGLLAAGLLAQGAWDLTAPGSPAGYRTLRSVLTAGALAGLLVGAAFLP